MGIVDNIKQAWFDGLATLFIGVIVTVVWIQFAKFSLSFDGLFDTFYPCYNKLSNYEYGMYVGIYLSLLFVTGALKSFLS